MPTYNPRDRKDVMLRQIREVIAEENRKDIIERLLKGRQERVRRGQPPGGNVGYGYRREGKRVSVDSAEAYLVRVYSNSLVEEWGGTAIATSLNDRGLTRRNGRSWTQRQAAAIVARRSRYEKGIIHYGDVVAENTDLIVRGGSTAHQDPI
jgi:DNA invertase Pin-like site-specific DNA recombinase